MWKLLSHVLLFLTLWTVAHQAPLSMEFSRHEYWSGLPYPSPGGSLQPRHQIQVSCIANRFFTVWVNRDYIRWGRPVQRSNRSEQMREDSEAGGTANTNALDQKCVLFKANMAGARGAGRGRDVSAVTEGSPQWPSEEWTMNTRKPVLS